ncbi:RWD domain-containing protein 4A, putative [Pediculus humanus corporis]|uniref:RWD domain-containing protein 4A, putative n=1 Tax=Pediculus humanus subsp. corporis TaxID=121224 RepID=E0VVT5_PEDHC|nr:RWD domain-containing protein 4A, putative [Pediculus humanus corporis]EEB17491.1 RWD domain-containing protein 4A, putative [Pediculus humanus corporis]
MSNCGLQEEEREVLLSIYDGDDKFRDISPTIYQYKYGEENDSKSFLVEVVWTENYPDEIPKINMNTFYNDHLSSDVKEKIANALLKEAELYLGTAMTYTLFEFVKEKEIEFTNEIIVNKCVNNESSLKLGISEQVRHNKTTKKEHLTKAQKRRQWDRVGSKGEKPRGWNWVDIVKHLSQTGCKPVNENTIQSN